MCRVTARRTVWLACIVAVLHGGVLHLVPAARLADAVDGSGRLLPARPRPSPTTGRFTPYPDSPRFIPEVIRTPVYPAFLAVLYTVLRPRPALRGGGANRPLRHDLPAGVRDRHGGSRRTRFAGVAALATALVSADSVFRRAGDDGSVDDASLHRVDLVRRPHAGRARLRHRDMPRAGRSQRADNIQPAGVHACFRFCGPQLRWLCFRCSACARRSRSVVSRSSSRPSPSSCFPGSATTT